MPIVQPTMTPEEEAAWQAGLCPPHRWRIDRPAGPTSMGYCQCGAKREFENNVDLEHVYTVGGLRGRARQYKLRRERMREE